jgi:hypothetical protein
LEGMYIDSLPETPLDWMDLPSIFFDLF